MNCIKNGKFTGDSCFGCKINADECDIRYKLLYRPRWIPVEERLPEMVGRYKIISGKVLITNGDQITFGWYRTNEWVTADMDPFARQELITAWMPLPERYKPEEESVN